MDPKVVLVVEDEPDMRFLLRLMLEHGDYAVEEAVTGEQAIGIVQRGAVDLMVLDMHLPGMNGLAVLQALQQKGLTQIPVLMVTADVDSTLAHQAAAAGAHGFISKTELGDALLDRVNEILIGNGAA
jgi:CheY-like chemotaxis protein